MLTVCGGHVVLVASVKSSVDCLANDAKSQCQTMFISANVARMASTVNNQPILAMAMLISRGVRKDFQLGTLNNWQLQ